MNQLEGRIAIVTGAGRGLGREHALLLAREGCKVVVNDLGGGKDGNGEDAGPAQGVVDEIVAAGGEAIANTDSVSSWEGAGRMIDAAVSAYGDLHILVNNAGILRDRTIVNMTQEAWESVVNVHLTGHFYPLKFAAVYWREQHKAGKPVSGSIINTTSGSGLFGNPGQVNYASAKAGIATMTLVAARELDRYGVRVNAIAPIARTRLTDDVAALEDIIKAPTDPDAFDPWDPAHVSPLVGYLASEDCLMTGQVFNVHGKSVALNEGWAIAERFERDGGWDIDSLRAVLKDVPPGPPAMTSSL